MRKPQQKNQKPKNTLQTHETIPNCDPRSGLDHPEPLQVIVMVDSAST
jgi:hypothetical protein